jgi:C4-dicarboxylate-specific signal transduction histidine kinase
VARAAVLVASVAGEALAEAGRRWPDLSFGVVADGPGAQSARALVRGGASGLRAIVDALVANACEGDGTLGPARVEIRVARVGDRVALDVVDDGPGFPAELLARPISLTGTTKETGSGLGLYTAEGIARGSGGSLTRENLPGGGARVRVLLPDEVAGEGVSR